MPRRESPCVSRLVCRVRSRQDSYERLHTRAMTCAGPSTSYPLLPSVGGRTPGLPTPRSATAQRLRCRREAYPVLGRAVRGEQRRRAFVPPHDDFEEILRGFRRYLEYRPAAPLTLRQVDPLIRELGPAPGPGQAVKV